MKKLSVFLGLATMLLLIFSCQDDPSNMDSTEEQLVVIDSLFSPDGGYIIQFKTLRNTYQVPLGDRDWIDSFSSLFIDEEKFPCSISFNVAGEMNNDNTVAFGYLKNENFLLNFQVYNIIDDNFINNTMSMSSLISRDMNILVLSVIDEELHYGVLDVVPQANELYEMDILPTTVEDLEDIISGL